MLIDPSWLRAHIAGLRLLAEVRCSGMQQEASCLPWLLSAHCVLHAPIYSVSLKVCTGFTPAALFRVDLPSTAHVLPAAEQSERASLPDRSRLSESVSEAYWAFLQLQ